MPNSPLETRLTRQIASCGEKDAAAVAHGLLLNCGHIKAGAELTGAGKTRQDLGGHGRTKDREAKQRGNKARDYKYDAKTNTATLKKKRALTSPCP